MGSIVKSIGKAIKSIGKGLKKVIKKLGPALLIAAAVYTGVAFMGAGGTAGGIGSLSPSNFMNGLGIIKDKVMGFISPSISGVPAVGQAGAAVPAATQAAGLGAAGNVSVAAGTAAMTGPGTVMGSAGGTAALNAAGTAATKRLVSSVAGGMTTGDAMIYMTKMNMLQTGLQAVAGFFDNSEEEQREHEKELLSMKYSFGAPSTDEQKEYLTENPNWISEHAAMQPQHLYGQAPKMGATTDKSLAATPSLSSPYIHEQRIGQPTFGRQGTRQFETPSPSAMAGRGPGMIRRGSQNQFTQRPNRRYA